MPVSFYEGQKQFQSWGGRVGAFLGTKIFRKTAACCVMLGIYLVVGHMVENYFDVHLVIPALIAAALSILMVLRTNSAYDRWWEGRKHWGALVNNCRNLALKIEAHSTASPADKALVGTYIILFPYLLRDHLRQGALKETLARLPESAPEGLFHYPAYVSGRIFALLKGWREEGKLDRLDYRLLDDHLSSLMDISGACERIRNSPLPMVYRALIPQFLILYLIVAPLGLEVSFSNLILTMTVSYFLIGLELVAEEIEEPFGTESGDLQLDNISKGIERSVREILPALREVAPISDLSK